MKKLIIFGIGEQAEMAYYCFKNDSKYEISAFTVNKDYIDRELFFDIPVIPFENIADRFEADQYCFFIAIGYKKLNRLREEKFLEVKKMGYNIVSYISSRASIFTENIGENCFILEDNTIQPFVEIGNNVTLWSGNHIGHHSKILDNCFLTSHVVVSGGVTIKENTFIGVNSTLRDHITIGKFNIIGAGALIMKTTEDNDVYLPSPTKKAKYSSDMIEKML